jgi:hypothetical protein
VLGVWDCPDQRFSHASVRAVGGVGPHLHSGVALTVCAAEVGVPLRTAQRWLAVYRQSGAAALARSRRSAAGVRKPPAELIGLIEGLALRKPPPQSLRCSGRCVGVAGGAGVAGASCYWCDWWMT